MFSLTAKIENKQQRNRFSFLLFVKKIRKQMLRKVYHRDRDIGHLIHQEYLRGGLNQDLFLLQSKGRKVSCNLDETMGGIFSE